MTATVRVNRDPVWQMVALCIANAGAFAAPYTTPLIIGALIGHFGISEARAGSLITAELVVMGVVALLSASLLANRSRRIFTIGGALLLLAGSVGAALAHAFESLYIWRVVAGVGAGMLLAGVNAVIASSVTPERNYGLVTLVACVITGFLTLVMPGSLEELGPNGYYSVLVGLMCAVTVLVLFIPDAMGKQVQSSSTGTARANSRHGWLLVAGIFFLGSAMMAYYAFIERLGVRLQVLPENIGMILTAMMAGSAAGAGLAASLGNRYGIVKPLLLVTLVHLLTVVCAVLTSYPWLYTCAVIAQGFCYMFIFPFLLALAGKLDVHGRWAAAASGASFLGFGVGPMVGGWLITQFGYEAIAWAMVGVTVPSLLVFRWVGLAVEKWSAPHGSV